MVSTGELNITDCCRAERLSWLIGYKILVFCGCERIQGMDWCKILFSFEVDNEALRMMHEALFGHANPFVSTDERKVA